MKTINKKKTKKQNLKLLYLFKIQKKEKKKPDTT